MSTTNFLQGNRAGAFTASLKAVYLPVQCAKHAALDLYGAARHVELSAQEAHLMVNMAAELEAAATNLRNAAGGYKPALRLVAAE
jgi:hypothetical protein